MRVSRRAERPRSHNEYALIDSTLVRERTSTVPGRLKRGRDEAIGRSKSGPSTKIHATVGALGNRTGFHLMGGQASDLDGADQLLACIASQTVIADKGYDADGSAASKCWSGRAKAL